MDFITLVLKFIWQIIFTAFVVVAVCLWLFASEVVPYAGNQLGRLIDRGNYSLHARQELADTMDASETTDVSHLSDDLVMDTVANNPKFFDHDYSSDIYSVDFSRRVEYKSFHDYSFTETWSEDAPIFLQFQQDDQDTTIPNDVPACSWKMGYDFHFDTRLPKSLGDRRDTIFIRKSARMGEAFREGAQWMAAIRYTLTSLKLERNPIIPGHMGPWADCDPDLGKYKTAAEWVAWNAAARQIHIDGAPKIKFRLVHIIGILPDSAQHPDAYGFSPWDPGVGIMGMCLVDSCTTYSYPVGKRTGEDDFAFRTDRDDLTSETPLLTANQEKAVKALQALGSDAYWLEQAHKNGVHNDALVLVMAGRVRSAISQDTIIYR